MKYMLLICCCLLVLLTLPACSKSVRVTDTAGSRPAIHVVERGENLFRIAWRYGLDFRDIALWNQLESPDRILAGQRLRLYPPAGMPARDVQLVSRPAAPAPTPAAQTVAAVTPVAANRTVRSSEAAGDWVWPTEGRVVSRFNPNQLGNKGIQISGSPAQSVRAASGGQVVYRGSGLRGYGRLLVVKHSNSTLSAYGHLGRIFVSEGDQVEQGQAIAELSDSGPPTLLHFEIRKNGNPVDPLPYLSG